MAGGLFHAGVQLRYMADENENQQLHGCKHQRLARKQLPRISAFPLFSIFFCAQTKSEWSELITHFLAFIQLKRRRQRGNM